MEPYLVLGAAGKHLRGISTDMVGTTSRILTSSWLHLCTLSFPLPKEHGVVAAREHVLGETKGSLGRYLVLSKEKALRRSKELQSRHLYPPRVPI